MRSLTLLLILFLGAFSLPLGAGGIGNPIRYEARSLFPKDTRFSPEQTGILGQIDVTELRDLEVKELRPSEVISAIRNRLASTPAADLVIRADPSVEAMDSRVTFSQQNIRLATALQYLARLAGVRFEFRGLDLSAASQKP